MHFDSLPKEKNAVINSFEYKAPNGESWSESRTRAMSYLRELGPGHHLVVTHGGLICALCFEIGLKHVVPNASLVSVEYSPEAKQLKGVSLVWEYS